MEAGVNLVADLNLAMSLSEASRLILDAILAQHIPVSLVDASQELPMKADGFSLISDPNPAYQELPRGHLYPVNLSFLHFVHTPRLAFEAYQRLIDNRYTIGFWFWELPDIPARFRSELLRVDEIWVASQYCQQIVQNVAITPVNLIPLPVAPEASGGARRSNFGLPDQRHIFLFMFAQSSVRKNPWAVIEAFRRAFGRPSDNPGNPLLVIKAQNLDQPLRNDLRASLADVNGVLLEGLYSRQETNDLLACADVYVSLHHAEGFGLSIAESMYLGKPVIATFYSANVDYMTEENSYPVAYSLRPTTLEDFRYDKGLLKAYQIGQLWAEPDVDDAARWMRHVYEHQPEGRQRGERAAADIRRYCSPSVVGQQIAARLEHIVSARLGLRTSKLRKLLEPMIVHQSEYLSALVALHGDRQRHNLARVPVLGYVWRLLYRLYRLGAVQEQQAVFNRMIMQDLEMLSRAIATLDEPSNE
jgi:glycosyltransferase involved in cell wall biosynthesis